MMPLAPSDDTRLDRTLGDLKESLRVLRMSSSAAGVSGAEDGDDVVKLREHLNSANASVRQELTHTNFRRTASFTMRSQRSQVRVQSETITLCENALRVQEEAVAILPSLLEREREQATAARERAAEAAERLATVHAELDGRKAQEKKLAHEAGLAHKRCALLLDGSELEHRTRRAGAEAEAVSGF